MFCEGFTEWCICLVYPVRYDIVYTCIIQNDVYLEKRRIKEKSLYTCVCSFCVGYTIRAYSVCQKAIGLIASYYGAPKGSCELHRPIYLLLRSLEILLRSLAIILRSFEIALRSLAIIFRGNV